MDERSADLKKFGFVESHLEKRERLLDSGIDPFPYSYEGVQKIDGIIARGEQELEFTVIAAGRIWSRREKKTATFFDIRDDTGKIQAYLPKNELTDRLETIMSCLDPGDVVGVQGKVFRTKLGELTIHVASLDILAKTVVPVPIGKEKEGKVYDRLSDPESQYRERYLTWMLNPEARERIIARSHIIAAIRRRMHERGFLEVATPSIEPVYGGAEARPFRTAIWALGGKEAYLRISPELYLKRYIVAGFDRVFTICQNFRNEGIDHSHNPEFTMMEWYEAFTDYEFQMKQFETLVAEVCADVHGKTVITYQGVELDFTPPWRRITVLDALAEQGVHASAMTAGQLNELLPKDDQGPHPWGVAVARLFERRCEDKLVQPTFVIDHPIDISPLTKVKRGDGRLVERFEPYVCRMEIGNAYSELTDPVDQLSRFRKQRELRSATDYDNHPLDVDFIKAVGCGMPPTGGVGLGVDRLIMLLTNAQSIRDIIPFPMVKSVTVPDHEE